MLRARAQLVGTQNLVRDITAALKKRVAELEKKRDIPEERVATLHANILRSFGHRSKGRN
jgi:hypothetical protein